MRYSLPKSVDEAADLLVSDLMITHMDALSRIDEKEFEQLYEAVADYIEEDFKLWTGNDDLLESCRKSSEPGKEKDPARIILERVREKMQQDTGVVIIT